MVSVRGLVAVIGIAGACGVVATHCGGEEEAPTPVVQTVLINPETGQVVQPQDVNGGVEGTGPAGVEIPTATTEPPLNTVQLGANGACTLTIRDPASGEATVIGPDVAVAFSGVTDPDEAEVLGNGDVTDSLSGADGIPKVCGDGETVALGQSDVASGEELFAAAAALQVPLVIEIGY